MQNFTSFDILIEQIAVQFFKYFKRKKKGIIEEILLVLKTALMNNKMLN